MNGLTQVCSLRVAGRLAPMGRSATGQPDLVMEPGRITAPAAKEVLDTLEPNAQGVALGQRGDVVFIRFRDLADAALDLNAGTATVEASDTAPPGMDQVLAAGPILALALALRGRSILHASAVSSGGRAVAFAAPSGGGKTTLAALACMHGAELVVDDTLVLDFDAEDPDQVTCLPGDRELRLRSAPAKLLAGASWPRRSTADGRLAMLAGSEELSPPALAAIILPAVTVDGTESAERLQGMVAMRALLACSRLVLLPVPGQATAMLGLAAALTDQVPIYRVTMFRLTRPEMPEPVRSLVDDHLFGAWCR